MDFIMSTKGKGAGFKSLLIASFIIACLFTAQARAIPSYIVDYEDNIRGVQGLRIGSSIWDVNFLDSGGYPFEYVSRDISSLIYSTDFSYNASWALLQFMDNAPELPGRVFGSCPFDDICFIVSVDAYNESAHTFSGNSVDGFHGPRDLWRYDGVSDHYYDTVTFAEWAWVASVPEPGSLILMCLGLLGVAACRVFVHIQYFEKIHL